MRAFERDEIMRFSGKLEGICAMLAGDENPEEEDDGTEMVRRQLLDIASDLESLAKGRDIPKPPLRERR